ncbi:MAG TPA: NifU family protein [Tissierellia bacterium]|nr:NifU family protein [Tissierellia bacterium]
MIGKIEKVLDKYVRPQLAQHYGNVKVLSFENGVLKVKLEGQCSNCPSARFTVEDVIEKEIKEHVPEVERVALIEGVSDELMSFARKILNKESQ